VDLDSDAEHRRCSISSLRAGDIPVVICRGTVVLANPDSQVADCLGLNPTIDRTRFAISSSSGPAAGLGAPCTPPRKADV